MRALDERLGLIHRPGLGTKRLAHLGSIDFVGVVRSRAYGYSSHTSDRILEQDDSCTV